MVLHKRQKGQGMTEFALILPILLLLLLGIIEASRVIWAYITVQTAAREAARYAIAGRPFIDSNATLDDATVDQICRKLPGGQEPDQVGPGVQPWLCDPDQRVDAVKEIALRRGRTLAVSRECTLPAQFFGNCAGTPGAFGIFIRGQVVTDTITGTTVALVPNHPGTEGLNVEVSTFYNIQMITPIFDVIMGGSFITLQGRVVMQNEGLDTAIGIEPPPPIDDPVISGTVDFGDGSLTREIFSVSGYTNIEQTQDLVVRLENHAQIEGPYDIYLEDSSSNKYKICSAVSTIGTGGVTDPNPACNLAAALPSPVPPGLYDLYSTPVALANRLATAIQQVEVVPSGSPQIVVDGGNIWTANSTTLVTLISHEPPDTYDVFLYHSDGTTLLATIATAVPVTSGPLTFQVPDVEALSGTACDWSSGSPCYVRSEVSGVSGTYAETELYVNQPEIVLVPSTGPYAQGETLRVLLKSHTPGKAYDIFINDPGPPASSLYLGTTQDTNALGDSPFPLGWPIPAGCGGVTGWPDGTYSITSQQNGQPDQIAIKPDVDILTPPDPFITVDGGDIWPAGSVINIELHNHEENRLHYVEFDSQRVPTADLTDDDTFETGECGTAVIEYTIPISTPNGSYEIASFLDAVGAGDQPNPQAQHNVQVEAVPYITVAEGDKVLPNQTITIELFNHAPELSYRVFYAQKELFVVQTDSLGQASVSYDLRTLPASPGPDLSDPTNLGTFYEMFSESTITDQKVASTTLALEGADLQVTKVELPPEIEINTTVPVTVTVKNLQPISITRYFDVDFYFNPTPTAPSHLTGYNFPGDAKHWQNFVAAAGNPGDTFTMVDQFLVQNYDPQNIYGYADTSNFVFEGEDTGEVANANNLLSGAAIVTCGAATTFNVNFNNAADLNDWQGTEFNNSHGSASINSNRLRLRHTNGSTWGGSDNHFIYYISTPISSTSGLDVSIKVIEAPNDREHAKAGISIRNSLASNSGKVDFALASRSNGSNRHRLQASRRPVGGSTDRISDVPTTGSETQVRLGNGPVWLRLVRQPGSDLVEYYWAQQNSRPTQDEWTFYGDTSAVDLADELYVGVFGTNYRNNNNDISNYSDSIFDNFSYTTGDPSLCPPPIEPEEDLPPGLTLCSDPLLDQSFEQSSSKWNVASGQNVSRSPGQAHTGNFGLLAPSWDSSRFNPWFYQKFTMPDWIISSTTTINLSLFKNIDNLGDDQSTDQFYAVLTTDASSISAALSNKVTTPTMVADGTGGAYDPLRWDPVNKTLPVIDPGGLESFAGQDLYLYLYNNSNDQGACSGPCTTKFYFDDVNLSPCTTQPEPDTIDTRIKGQLTLHFSDGSSDRLEFVKLWAYAENDDTLYETFSLQDGEFNFYNLPATPEGTEYFIFAQYHLVDPFDPSQIETLAADTSIILKSTNGNDNPAETALDLFTLAPGP